MINFNFFGNTHLTIRHNTFSNQLHIHFCVTNKNIQTLLICPYYDIGESLGKHIKYYIHVLLNASNDQHVLLCHVEYYPIIFIGMKL
jgi:hypothetical protein